MGPVNKLLNGTVPRDFLIYFSFHPSTPSDPWLSGVKLYLYGFTFAMILTLKFFSPLYPTMQIKTNFFNNLCLKNGFCTPLLEVLWCMFTLSLLFLCCLQWGLNFLNSNPHCSNYSVLSAKFSALLPTAQKNYQHCCQQQRSLFCVVAYNAGKCSNFSLFVFFCVVVYNANYFSRVLDHRAEKWSALMPTQRKNCWRCWQQGGKMFEFEYFHEFETRCEFTLGF